MLKLILIALYLVIGLFAGHFVAEQDKSNKLKIIGVCFGWPIIAYAYIGMLVILFVDTTNISNNPLYTVFACTFWPLFVIFILALYLGRKLINVFKK